MSEAPSPTHPYLAAQRALSGLVGLGLVTAGARGGQLVTPHAAWWGPTLALAPVFGLVALRLARWRHAVTPPTTLTRAAAGLGLLGPLVALQAHARWMLGAPLPRGEVAEQLLHAGTASAGAVLALGAVVRPHRLVSVGAAAALVGVAIAAGSGRSWWLVEPLVLAAWAACVSVALRRQQRREYPAHDADRHDLRGQGFVTGAFRLLADLRDLLRPLPFFTMRSDIVDVVYLSWLLPPARAQTLLPPPLAPELRGGATVLSILTYRHGGFGPAFLGPLRRLLPSPAQSNWRLYVEADETVPAGSIYFVQNPLDRWLHVVGSRLLTDGLPAQHASPFVHRREGRRIHTALRVEDGVDLEATVVETTKGRLPAAWEPFDSWDDAVAYLVPQNRAVLVAPHLGRIVASEIDIPIDRSHVRPARVERLESRWLKRLVGDAEPFAFVVERVPFRALGETTLLPR